MARRKAIIHRYDNEPDILAVERNGCSEIYKRAKDDEFELVIVIPTLRARTSVAVVAEAVGPQFTPEKARAWPGRPDAYPVRINVSNVRYTTVQKVRHAMQNAGQTWEAAWVVKSVVLEEADLF
jgi:hypothetical protein